MSRRPRAGDRFYLRQPNNGHVVVCLYALSESSDPEMSMVQVHDFGNSIYWLALVRLIPMDKNDWAWRAKPEALEAYNNKVRSSPVVNLMQLSEACGREFASIDEALDWMRERNT